MLDARVLINVLLDCTVCVCVSNNLHFSRFKYLSKVTKIEVCFWDICLTSTYSRRSFIQFNHITMSVKKNECIICCEDVDECSSLECQHKTIFHETCLNKWGRGRCPLCRAQQSLAMRARGSRPASGILADMPDAIRYSEYATYDEKMRAYIGWMFDVCDQYGMDQEIVMTKDSVADFTEEDYCFINSFQPEEERGFMWSSHPVLERVKDKAACGFPGHSGSSLGWTLRFIQHLVRM